jgi:putative nucleotidyltransferase with HDIG domain
MLGSPKKQPRLGQWDGRRHSSRHGPPVLARLLRPGVLLRLLPVLVTVLLATLLVYASGPPLPYRYGEVCDRELRARLFFEVVDEAQTERKRDEAVERLPPEQRDDPDAREETRQAEPPVLKKYFAGSPLVRRGEPIRREQMTLLEEEQRAYRRSQDHLDRLARGGALFLIHGLLASLVVLYVVRFQKGLAQSLPKIAGVCVLVLMTLGLAMVMSRSPWYAVLIPLTFTALVLTIAYNPPFALLLSLTLSLATTVALGSSLQQLLVQMAGLATAVLSLRNVRTRTRLVRVGLLAGVVYLLMTIGTDLLSEQMLLFIALDAVRNLVWGTMAGFLVSGCLPLVERCFSLVTDITLLELADGSHPLQQELIRRAPGTYTHSMTVATLAEPAAEAIGADPLLTRVGAYFHDVGKMLKPDYFVENQSGENRHQGLEPALSTLVIIGHVKDGVALAEQYRLPRPVIDFIQQHHGTTLVEYFYREALRLRDCQENGHAELEPTFRYPGPRPRNRENGIVMLADAVESSSRALTDPTPGSLRKLVHEMLMKRLLDGQFDESGLTLTELHVVEEALSKGLIALYHSRIKYPEVKERPPARPSEPAA